MKQAYKLLLTALPTVALFLSLGQAQTTATATSAVSKTTSVPTALPATFEIDLVYPRNETYNATDTFPIVLALQNPLLASHLGKFTFGWYIMPYDDGSTPGGISVGGKGEWIRSYSAANFTEDTYFLVNVTNALEWSHGISYSGKGVHAIIWTLQWDHALDVCGHQNDIGGRVFFTIDKSGRNPDIMDIQDQCPTLGSIVQINNNVTDESTCPGITKLQGNGNPCSIKLDAAKASSMSAEVASLATPPPVASTTAVEDNNNLASVNGISSRLLQALVFLCASLLWTELCQ